MAKIVIVIKDVRSSDVRNDTLVVKMKSDPPWPGPAAQDQTITLAQSWGLKFLKFITNECKRNKRRKKKESE